MTIGALLRKAGFRWVFIFTMPLPFHPAVLWLVVFGPPVWIAWLGWSIFDGDGTMPRWWQPLIVALLLGIPLSIPFVAWGMMMFRAHLAQAILIAGSMLLLALEVAAGTVHPLWAMLPTAFVLLYLVQAIGGPYWLRTLQRRADEWVPVDPGNETITIVDEMHTAERARRLIERCDIARMASFPSAYAARAHGARAVMIHRLSANAAKRLREMIAIDPPGWTLVTDPAKPFLMRPIESLPDDCLTLTIERYRAPLWIVAGPLERFSVQGAQFERHAIWGSASIVQRLPLFTCFHWTAIVGQSEWHVGFARKAPVRLGPTGNLWEILPQFFVERGPTGGRNDDEQAIGASGDEPAAGSLAAATRDAMVAEQERIDAFWQWIVDHPTKNADGAVMARLRDTKALIRPGDGKRLAAWLATCKVSRGKRNAINAAVLLERLPQEEFVAARAEIFDVLNSRIMAGEWRVGPDMDMDDVPRNCPRFGDYGGFGLMIQTSPLYDRLAALGPEEAAMVEKLRASLGPAFRWTNKDDAAG